MTDVVTHHADSVTGHAASETENDFAFAKRRKQTAARNARYRARCRVGRVRLVVEPSRKQLDALEERGYLDPFARGEPGRINEREAIETFLAESLARPR